VSSAKALELGLYPFAPGDLMKLYLAAALLPTAWRLLDHEREGAGLPRKAQKP
jgi:hypothetical protein